DALAARLPERKSTIFHLPYGVRIPERSRRRANGGLRAIFAGRLDVAKGVLDLPAIDRTLRQRGVRVSWTVAGAGPAEREMRRLWAFTARVRWTVRLSSLQLEGEYLEHDVFVLPT